MAERGKRIGIVGAGAIGGFYGTLLARAGHDVHFLLRSEYETVRQQGLTVHSAVHGALHLDGVQAYRHAEQMPACDWLLLGAKTTSNAELAPLLGQIAAPGARIVSLQNGLGVEDALCPLLPAGLHLLGGLCYVCAYRSAPGVVEHQSLGAVSLAYHSGPAAVGEASAIVDDAVQLFGSSGVNASGLPDLEQARWQKLVWNAPYNGVSVLLDAGTKGLMSHPQSRLLVKTLMEETIRAAAACGYVLPAGLADRMLAGTDAMPDYFPSMYHDFKHRRPLELEAIYEVPLSRAVAAGCDMPRTEMLLQALKFIAR